MKVIALVKAPKDPEAAAQVLARESGTTLAEARMRLAPEPPALLARLVPEATDAIADRLRAGGLQALAISTQPAPGRTRVKSVDFQPNLVRFLPRAGEALEIPFGDIAAILRGISAVTTESETIEKQKKLNWGATLAGLPMQKTVTRTVRSETEDIENAIYVYAADGRCAVLRELSMELAWLGKALQPSRTANMMLIARMLRERAPGAFYDERLVRLGRRPVPFLALGESQVSSKAGTTTTQDTSSVLDLLAEALFQGVRQRMLP